VPARTTELRALGWLINTPVVRIVLGVGDGSFGQQADFPIAVGSSAVTTARLNSDSRPDIVVSIGGGVSVLRNTTPLVDATPPKVALPRAGAPNQLVSPFVVWWSGPDAGGSGVASYDVRVRKAAWNKSFGSYVLVRSKTAAGSASFTGVTGYEYCYSVRGRDKVGNVSPWSADSCTALPLDDRSLVRSHGWSAKKGRSFLYGTYLETRKRGRTLTRAGVPAGRAALIVGTGPGYGAVSVSHNGKVVKKFSLASGKGAHQGVVVLPRVTKATKIVITTTREQACTGRRDRAGPEVAVGFTNPARATPPGAAARRRAGSRPRDPGRTRSRRAGCRRSSSRRR
jgi:hypothetical protein